MSNLSGLVGIFISGRAQGTIEICIISMNPDLLSEAIEKEHRKKEGERGKKRKQKRGRKRNFPYRCWSTTPGCSSFYTANTLLTAPTSLLQQTQVPKFLIARVTLHSSQRAKHLHGHTTTVRGFVWHTTHGPQVAWFSPGCSSCDTPSIPTDVRPGAAVAAASPPPWRRCRLFSSSRDSRRNSSLLAGRNVAIDARVTCLPGGAERC